MSEPSATIVDHRLADSFHDAVVVIPGIMGSELRDATTGDVLWGMGDLSWYASAWRSGRGLADLCLTEDERAGRYGRIKAHGLLHFPSFARVLQGFEPYTSLIQTLRAMAVDPSAVCEFAYDWRLPVKYNAGRLAEAMYRHLITWRSHPAHRRAQATHPVGRPAQLVLVAHSMGGLLVRALPRDTRDALDIRTTITLGTPFGGSIKAAVMLNTGRGSPVPLPARRSWRAAISREGDDGLRALVATLPGLHDLLPAHDVVEEVDVDQTARLRGLTPADVADIGGNEELARTSLTMHARLADAPLTGHRSIVGVGQRTPQTMSIFQGVVTAHEHVVQIIDDGVGRRTDRGGDGTVSRGAAKAPAAAVSYLPQQHGALASSPEAIDSVIAVITEHDDVFGPHAGTGYVGIETPDLVWPAENWPVSIVGVARPSAVNCYLEQLGTRRRWRFVPEIRDGVVQAWVAAPQPGLYRVHVIGTGMSAVTQLVCAVDPDE